MIKALPTQHNPSRPHESKAKRLLKIPQRNVYNTVMESDLCVIDIPDEMLIVGNLSPHIDGLFAKVISVNDEDAHVELIQGGERVTLPLFCLTKKTDVLNKRNKPKVQALEMTR